MGDRTSSIIEFFTLPDAGFLMTYLIAFMRNSTSSPKATDSSERSATDGSRRSKLFREDDQLQCPI